MSKIGEQKYIDLGSLAPIHIEIMEILEKEYKVKYLNSSDERFEYLPKELVDYKIKEINE